MKIKKALTDFLTAFMMTFLAFSFISLLIASLFSGESWTTVLISETQSFFIYLTIYSLVTSLGITIYLNYREQRLLRKVNKGLRMFIEGNYSADIFLKMSADDTPVQISDETDHLFLRLHEKLILMADEVVTASEQNVKINGKMRGEIVEQERHRIARELHDSVSQQLFASSMMLSAVNEKADELPEKYRQQLKMIESTINESQLEMRALLLHLRPIQLEGKTLKQGIEQLLKELSTKVPIQMTFEIQDVYLNRVVEDHLFRIVQELLSNVLRHAKAEELNVYLSQDDEKIQLRVIDDGIGFDPKVKKTGSYGLLNTRERIESMGGHLKIISFPNQGSHIDIVLPNLIGG